jgi:hypothetical protein
VWPLAFWTLWRWRRQWRRRHIALPLATVVVGVVSSVAMGGSDRALMLATPGLAVLGAFALPTLKRSAGALIDWFSVFFFSLAALAVWVIYLSMQTGVPAKPMANILRLARRVSHPASPRWRWAPPRWAAWHGCGWCDGAHHATATHCGKASCCRPAAWRWPGC